MSADVSRDLIHPGDEAVLGAECFLVFQNAQEDLLHQIFASRAGPVHPAKEVEEADVISLKENCHTDEIAVSNRKHERFVCWIHRS
ncbi:hypothetical protein D3C83_123750 [compost metagenome]